jgi:uncharacterized protein YkwD
MNKFWIVAMAGALAACGGGAGDSATTTPAAKPSSVPTASVTATVSPTAVASPTPSAAPTASGQITATPTKQPTATPLTATATPVLATPTSRPTVTPTAAGGLYQRQPVVANCDAGELNTAERNKVLDKLNAVRARHGLLPVTYDASDDAASAAAALYMVANKTLTHSPSGGLCYSSEAATMAGSSNLYMSYGYNTETSPSAEAIVAYLIDDNVASLGHRRWILSPFLAQITFGRVDGIPSGGSQKYMASTLRVMGDERKSLSGMNQDFVAYPQGVYPASEFKTDWYLSFAAIASTSNAWDSGDKQVNYGGATITVTGGGSTLIVSGVSANYDGYGMPNHLQWKVAGLKTGVTYTVKIAGVSVNGVQRDYSYTFSLS